MTLTHEIRQMNGNDVDWNKVNPIAINHYLWLDNGYKPEVQVRLVHSDDLLKLHYRVFEENPLIRYTAMNDPVYMDSCIEFFVQPTPETDARYLNFEWNAGGALLLGLGEGRGDRVLIKDTDPGLFSFRSQIGLVHPEDGRRCWEAEFSIPVPWIQNRFPAFELTEGKTCRANFYKCGDETALPHFGCWNRVQSTTPDFHRSEDFGILRFIR
jgi:hypothetical protein